MVRLYSVSVWLEYRIVTDWYKSIGRAKFIPFFPMFLAHPLKSSLVYTNLAEYSVLLSL